MIGKGVSLNMVPLVISNSDAVLAGRQQTSGIVKRFSKMGKAV